MPKIYEGTMSMMQWNEQFELGVTRMDNTHREFIEFYNALVGAAPEEFLDRFDAFIDHTVAHFDQENRWMEHVNFPACHRAEHDRVLAVMRDVRKRVEQGDAFLGKRLLEELPPWFENHASTMDAALAFHLQSIGYDVEREELAPASSDCCGGCMCSSSAATA